jgi:hypothetical protein
MPRTIAHTATEFRTKLCSMASPHYSRTLRVRFITRRRQTRFLDAAGFDTALRAVLKTSPGRVLSEGPTFRPESKPEGRTIRAFMNSPG